MRRSPARRSQPDLPVRRLLAPALSCLALLAACAAQPDAQPVIENAELGTTKNVHALGDVWTAGQPSAEDLERARDAGFKTIATTRHARETPGFDEEQLVTELGLGYVEIPFAGPEELTDEVFDRSRELLQTAERPLLFHCGSANRIGAVWIPWRVLDGGLGFDEALAEARTIGLRTDAYAEKAADYIERRAQ